MASITKRNGKYLVRVRLRGNVRTKTFRTSAEAKAWAAQTEAEITSRALGITPKNQTVGDIIRRYRAEVTPTKRGSRSEDIRLARFLRDPICDIKTSEVMPHHFAEWRDRRLKEVQAPSVARELTTVSAVFNHALREWQTVTDNPISKINRPKHNPSRTCRPTADEIRRICHYLEYDELQVPAMKKQRVALAFLFAIETAMRAGEICGITWQHIDLDRRTVHLTDDGLRRVEDDHPGRDLFGTDSEFLVSLNLALHAHAALERDVDYLVADNRVWLVSGSRGRVDRLQRWPDGLQLAVEAKEALDTAPGLQVLDQLVIAELVGGYEKLVGMSATMRAADEELESLYGLQVAVIPSHLPCRRTDHPTRLHATSEHRDAALADLVRDSGERGRPVLVATQSVRESERIADLLRGLGVECVLLNARNATEEAAIISRAGEAGRVTVSTQMAGRGTDVVPSPEAVDAGGLLVVGVGRFPSARLDDQLRGRAGRQGDPGESVFLASLADRLVTDNDPDHPEPAVVDGGGEVEQCRANRRVLGVVDHAQRISDGDQRNLRWLSWRYGELLRRQRAHLVEVRETCLEGPEALDRLADHAPEEVAELCERVGEDELEEGARLALVAALDAAWSAHLGHAAELREGIHLRVLAREDPLTEFEKEMGAAYQGLSGRILDDAVAALLEAPVVDGRLDLESLGSRIPSATWAYTVTDNELGDDFTRMGRALRRRLAGDR